MAPIQIVADLNLAGRTLADHLPWHHGQTLGLPVTVTHLSHGHYHVTDRPESEPPQLRQIGTILAAVTFGCDVQWCKSHWRIPETVTENSPGT
jgi:hypothetical protein